MKFKYLAIAAGSISALSLTGLAFAAQITFQGEVNDQTCQVRVNGQENAIVLLPTVSTAELGAANATAGVTPFTVSISGCKPHDKDAALKIKTNFLGRSVTATGVLINTASTNAATKVGLQLMDKDAGGTPIKLNGVTAVAGLELPKDQTRAAQKFAVRYISEEGGATAGAVSAIVDYSITYY